MDRNILETVFIELSEFLGARATRSLMHRIAYSRDWSPLEKHNLELPDVVVIPKTTEEMVQIAKIALKYEIPIIPFGGGTGMAGGVISHRGDIMVETKGMNKALEVDEKNLIVTVQAGMTVWELNEVIARLCLWFPHQPESKRSCTIGGSIACDNTSTYGLRYGKIRDYITNAVVVTGRAEAVRVGHRKSMFSSTGYKLMDLLIGSEGTLGVITEATLRIFPMPKFRQTRGYFFSSLNESMKGLEKLLSSGISIESAHIDCRYRLHFSIHNYRETFGHEAQVPNWTKAALFLSFAGNEQVVNFNIEEATKILINEFQSELIQEKELVNAWWDSKDHFIPFQQKWPDSQRQKRFSTADLGLPIGRLDEGYQHYVEIAQKWDQEILGVTVYNLSPNKPSASISFAVFVDDSSMESINRFYQYTREMSEMAIDLEGTMSSILGDGDRLGEFNQLEHGLSLEYMHQIKGIFDPKNIMNPGKKFESHWFCRKA